MIGYIYSADPLNKASKKAMNKSIKKDKFYKK